MLAGLNSNDVKATCEMSMLFQNDPPSFKRSSKIYPHSSGTLSHTLESVTNGSRLRCHNQVGRCPFQDTWAWFSGPIFCMRSMWPTGQTSNSSVIKIRVWRYPVPSGPSGPNSWPETHFVLLDKIIEYAVFQPSLSHWVVIIENY